MALKDAGKVQRK